MARTISRSAFEAATEKGDLDAINDIAVKLGEISQAIEAAFEELDLLTKEQKKN